MKLSNDELKRCIYMLYQTLCNTDILIGGYYFKISQVDEMLDYYFSKKLDVNIEEVSNYQKGKKHSKMKASSASRLIICTLSKEQKLKLFPVMDDEFLYVIEELQNYKNIVDLFLSFCLNTLETVENPDEFMVFVNDYYEETLLDITTQKSF